MPWNPSGTRVRELDGGDGAGVRISSGQDDEIGAVLGPVVDQAHQPPVVFGSARVCAGRYRPSSSGGSCR